MPPDRGVALHQFKKNECPSTSLKRVSGIATRDIPYNNKINYKLSKQKQAPKPYIPPELGKSAKRFADRAHNVGFFQECVEARGPHELNKLPRNPHPATALLEQMRVHGVPIKTERGMTDTELTQAIRYGAHSSATKETIFVRKELQEKSQPGQIALFPLRAVRHLPKLWLSLLASIAQRGRKPRLIYDFSWSGLNEAVTQVAHKEAMWFGKALYRVINCILKAPPKLGPTFLNKVDLSDACMRIWLRLEDIPSVAFLVTKATPEEDQLVGFHLSIPMGYV